MFLKEHNLSSIFLNFFQVLGDTFLRIQVIMINEIVLLEFCVVLYNVTY